MERKYKLTDESLGFGDKTLYRIMAVRDFGLVKSGDLGGYIESDGNLLYSGNAWVSGDAQVYGSARVSGNAWVSGDALVYGNARVYGDARVSGDARVYGDAWVSGNALVYGNARVYGDAQVSGNALVSGNARVSGDALVSGNAWVSGDARVYGNALVYGNARVSEYNAINIVNLRWPVTITDNHIQIGCELKTINTWAALKTTWIKNHYSDQLIWWNKYKDAILLLADREEG